MRVNPWVPLVGTLAYNFRQHRRGRPTLCSTTRRVIPMGPLAVLLVLGFVGLGAHLYDGYAIKINLDNLTD